MLDNHDNVLYMPDGRPAPAVMTEAELVRCLRLDTLRLKHPEQSIARYRDEGKLKPTKISGRNFYTQRSISEFLQTQTK